MFKHAMVLTSVLLVSACATTPQVPQATRAELAPTGKLRAGFNLGNTLLSAKDPATGVLRGVAVDLAHELGKRLGVPVEVAVFDSPAQLAEGAETDAWDIGFLAVEPARATIISFSPAYPTEPAPPAADRGKGRAT